jgi:hypothetical protein
MILKALCGLSLVINVSLDSQIPAANPAAWMQMSVRERDATLLPLVQRATECILRQASVNPHDKASMRPREINDLIVQSIAACRRSVQEMIDAHDRLYGVGSGKAFLLGPYLDVLPAAVVQRVMMKTPER